MLPLYFLQEHAIAINLPEKKSIFLIKLLSLHQQAYW